MVIHGAGFPSPYRALVRADSGVVLMPYEYRIAEQLKYWLRVKHVTVSQLAERLNAARSYILRWKDGKKVRLETVMNIASALGLTPNQFMKVDVSIPEHLQPCGVNKVLDIIGRDYLGSSPVYSVKENPYKDVHKVPVHGLSDESDKNNGGY